MIYFFYWRNGAGENGNADNINVNGSVVDAEGAKYILKLSGKRTAQGQNSGKCESHR